MQAKLLYLSDFLNTCWQQPEAKQSKRAKPQTYTSMSFLLFFMLMLLKRIHAFAAIHRWAKANYVLLGWQQAPDRKTIRRRFLALPALIQPHRRSETHACHCSAVSATPPSHLRLRL